MLSKTFPVLLAVLFVPDFAHGHTNQFRSDYTYIDTLGSYYKFHSTRKTWRDAKRTCSQEGASLFYPENANEANAVLSFWKRFNPFSPSTWQTYWLYVGISDIVNEGEYETIDGKPISEAYYIWRPQQPDNAYNGEDCLHLFVGDGKLNDISCDDKYSFICKKSLQSDGNCKTRQSKSGGLTNQPHFRADYTYLGTFGSQVPYYKFHSTRQTWRDAKRICSQEGASLFYPENAAEANAVLSFWKRINPFSPSTWQTYWMYVGISDIVTEGVYETIDGKSISEAYHIWRPQQPDNAYNGENCLHLFVGDGKLNDISCDDKYSFICKKSFQLNRNCNTQQSNSAPTVTLREDEYHATKSTLSLDQEEDYQE